MTPTGASVHTFPKSERLTGKKQIEELFRHGSSLFFHPFLLKYRRSGEDVHRVLVGVPKKKFKRATDRNLMKRRIKEAYRLNKFRLYEQPHTFYHVAIIYQGDQLLSYEELSEKLVILLSKFQKKAL